MDTKVISAFPACGKTYAFEKLSNEGRKVLDSDSSLFSWIERERTEEELQELKEAWDSVPHLLSGDEYIEKIRHDKIKVRNPEFPNNYIQHIKDNIGKVDYIFVSSHKEVRDALIENNIWFTLVYPARHAKAEWVGRCFLRGSGEKFCQLIADNWDKWIDEIEEVKRCNKRILGYGCYWYLKDLIECDLI